MGMLVIWCFLEVFFEHIDVQVMHLCVSCSEDKGMRGHVVFTQRGLVA